MGCGRKRIGRPTSSRRRLSPPQRLVVRRLHDQRHLSRCQRQFRRRCSKHLEAAGVSLERVGLKAAPPTLRGPRGRRLGRSGRGSSCGRIQRAETPMAQLEEVARARSRENRRRPALSQSIARLLRARKPRSLRSPWQGPLVDQSRPVNAADGQTMPSLPGTSPLAARPISMFLLNRCRRGLIPVGLRA